MNDDGDVSAEADAVQHPGIDATSKACRYDDGPGWSDCDPFELIRYRVLRLIHGGSQCEEMKNITKHCTPHDFPFGTHWLIQEHRKCIAELNRLKAMIADLHKFIETLHEKGKELFSAYLKLKKKLDDLKAKLEKLKVEGEHQQEVLAKLKTEIEEWKTKARELQMQVDELKAKYHDLQAEEHEIQLKNTQLKNDVNVVSKENEGLEKKIDKLARENEELHRRLVEYEHIKDKVREKRVEKNKLEVKLDRLKEYLEKVKDDLAEQRVKNLKAKIPNIEDDEVESKDTHVDLSMEMFITHNKTTLYSPTYAPIYYSTPAPYYKKYDDNSGKGAKCLISYYGYTNETCWYETDGERSEDSYVDALGHHLVEAHWKYFTIDVADQSECDKASHLHYEFLINRCSPKHYLPVLSVFRPNGEAKSLGTHFYPKTQSAGKTNQCWITFLGAHGHCEAHNSQFDLYNTDDTPEGYSAGSGNSADACLARAEWWMKFCDTPVIATYVPEGVSSNWQPDWIMHDSHGGRMFEESESTQNHINPDSLNPHGPVDRSLYKSEYKSQAPKSPDYHDSPEYRKSLHLEGEEKEAVLKQLRERLGMSGAASRVSKDVLHHQGVETSVASESSSASEQSGMSAQGYGYASEAPAPAAYEAPASEAYSEAPASEAPYSEAPYSEAPASEGYSEAPASEAPYSEAPASEGYSEAPASEAPYSEAPASEAPYEAPTEAPAEQPYEAPSEAPAEEPYEAPAEEAPKY